MKNIIKIAIITLLISIFSIFCAMQIFAYDNSFFAPHYCPTGTTSTEWAYPSSECNRKINVTFYDTNGTLIKKVSINTKHGADNYFHIEICGYDITKFESNQGLWETCKIVGTSGSGNGTDTSLNVNYYFRTAASKDELNITVTLRKWDAVQFEVRHYVQMYADETDRKYYSLHSTTDKKSIYVDDYISTYSKSIPGYTLRDDYESGVAGNLCFVEMPGSYENLPTSPRCYEYDYHEGDHDIDAGGKSSFDESKDGKLSYSYNRKFWVEYFYDLKEYTISYNANGGTGAPATQTKIYGENISLSTTTPTRDGFTFKGWGTYTTDTTVNYLPGGEFTTNGNMVLYAIWEEIVLETYDVRYNANGGSGAPLTQTKTQGETLYLSSSVPTKSNHAFKGWSTSTLASDISYQPGDAYTNNANIVLYAIWERTGFHVIYNANGGEGAPEKQIKQKDVDLILSSSVPTIPEHRFLGWAASSSSTMATYMPGGTYSENDNITLYAVWERMSFTVSYDANGGSGAPESQTKYRDMDLELSTTVPVRSYYDFLGWSTNKAATSATYQPGNSYTSNASITLYAVWTKTNYDFSISNLTVSNSSPYKYGQITVQVRTDSWDQINAYSSIPVQLYYGGSLVSTQNVNFSVYGVANITFTLNVGSSVGNKTIEARIYWAKHNSETRTTNNTVSTTINVKEFNYDMSSNVVTPSADYSAGSTVITSFTINNDSDFDIIPSMRNNVAFTAYYYNGSQKTVISSQKWNNVVIPSGGSNLVYFKWTVPTGIAGKIVYCECTTNADGYLYEENMGNNTVAYSSTVVSNTTSQTPNTRYESTKPSSYKNTSTPATSTDTATWNQWEYENGAFVLKTYGVQISYATPVITPSSDCTTAVYENGMWKLGSGYGFTISYAPTVSTMSGYSAPSSSAYTNVQQVVAHFPEFNYLDTAGNCRTLVYVNGKYQFVENADAVNSDRIHFIPVWFNDGNYTVSVTATQVWTPVGMIEAVRNSNTFTISGTMYDDFYVGS